LHTGDISHLSKPEEFDTVDQNSEGRESEGCLFTCPAEHDVLNDDGKQFLERYGKGSKGAGWYSFEKKGVHFIGLVKRDEFEGGAGWGLLATINWKWLEDDVKTLIEEARRSWCFAHIPLWSVYPEMGMGHGRQRASVGLSEKNSVR